MKMRDQRGAIDGLLLPFIMVLLLFVGAVVFGVWAFNGRQDYKNHTDQKIAAAVALDKQQTQAADAKTYAEAAKDPLRDYVGSAAFGSIVVKYPKTWSAYVIENNSGSSTPIDGYFQPSFVPDVGNTNNSFALRVQVNPSSYDSVLSNITSSVQSGATKVTPYSLPKVPSVIGSLVQGQLNNQKVGTMVILPLRNRTLEIWNETSSAASDFANIILPNMSFSP